MPVTADERDRLIRLEEQVKTLKEDYEELKEKSSKDRDEYYRVFATKIEVNPVLKLAYSGVGFFITAVIGGFITWLVKGGMGGH